MRIHLMECMACRRFGSPIRADDKVCGNCGGTETVMWFRELADSFMGIPIETNDRLPKDRITFVSDGKTVGAITGLALP